jgi:hypothetical protein
MSPKRNGLLIILLVPAMLLAAATWTSAAAGVRWAPGTVTGGPPTVQRPGCTPLSGEPDVGGTPAPRASNRPSGYEVSAPTRTDATQPWFRFQPWVRLVFRTWSVWFPGLS